MVRIDIQISMQKNKQISVVIPTFNEADSLRSTIGAVKALGDGIEIMVVDGESTDETVFIARKSGVSVILSECGRGIQLHAGALAATGSVLWFLHADSIPPPAALREIREALSDENVVGGNFALRFDGDSPAAAFLTWFYNKVRHIGLLYGDSGIFVRRDAYQQIGGFKPIPLFEDLEFVGRLKRRGKLVRVKSEITTSSRRFESRPFLPVFFRWVLYQCLYWIGISPFCLARSYHPIRRQTDMIKSTK